MRLEKTAGNPASITAAGFFTVAELKRFLWIDESNTDYDSELESIFLEQFNRFEEETGIAALAGTYVASYKDFPAQSDRLNLIRGPITGVTTVAYTDTDDLAQTFTDFEVFTGMGGGLKPTPGNVWPPAYQQRGEPVTVTYSAGYASGSAPAELVECLKVMIYEAFHDRAGETNQAQSERKLSRFRHKDAFRCVE